MKKTLVARTKDDMIVNCFGLSVEVEFVMENYYEGGKKLLHRKNLWRKIRGKVVGWKRFYLGGITNCGEGNFLDIKSRVLLYEVKIGLLNKPLYVSAQDLHIIEEDFELPVLWRRAYKWTEHDRECIRDAMKGVPRDEKGRWLE